MQLKVIRFSGDQGNPIGQAVQQQYMQPLPSSLREIAERLAATRQSM